MTIGTEWGGRGRRIDDFYGLIVDAIEIDQRSDTLIVSLRGGYALGLSDEGQHCCEHRFMSCDDDLRQLVGGRLLSVEVRDGPDIGGGECHETQFLEVTTDKGFATIVNHNEHNGYYGGFSLRLAIVKEPIAVSIDVDETPFQDKVAAWVIECFGERVAANKLERNHRFLEEALELVQSLGCSQAEAHQLVDYVYGRPIGEPTQEVGGVMITLAGLCSANCFDMNEAGDIELDRVWSKIEMIRAKQATKKADSALPGNAC